MFAHCAHEYCGMPAGTAGAASPVPAPVAVEVYDSDLEAMRADFRRHCHGVPRPWILGIGIVYLGLAVLKLVDRAGDWWFWALCGALFILMSTRAGAQFPPAVRTTGLRFSADGLDVDVAFEKNPRRHYSWRGIRAINDIGDSFVLVPAFGRRLVFPKRSFSDGGREAWAFFAAHGVAGRVAKPQGVSA
jgi:hypothetical protein